MAAQHTARHTARKVAGVVAVLGLLLGMAAPVAAHNPLPHQAQDLYVNKYWPVSQDADPNTAIIDVPVYYDWGRTFPSQTWKDRVFDALEEWNSHQGVGSLSGSHPINFVLYSYPTVVVSNPDDACTIPYNWTIVVGYRHRAPDANNILATEDHCYTDDGKFLKKVYISVNSSESSFHIESGPPPSSKWDLLAALVHEFGHGIGWHRREHFCPGENDTNCLPEETGLCGNDVLRQSMCRSQNPGSVANAQRTLGDHDLSATHSGYWQVYLSGTPCLLPGGGPLLSGGAAMEDLSWLESEDRAEPC